MKTWSAIGAVALIASFLCPPAWAIDFRRPPQQRNLPPELGEKLTDTLSGAAEPYMGKEEENKAQGKPYVDLQQKFQYLPNWGPNGQVVVSAKLGGAEYVRAKGKTGKGVASGKLKYLVFTYALSNGKWVPVKAPKWESQDLGAEAGKKMTASALRAEKYKAAQAKLKARAEAAQKAMDKKRSKPGAAAAAQQAGNGAH